MNYNNISYEIRNKNKNDNSAKFGNIYNETNNDKFDKIIVRKPEESVIANSKEKKDTKNVFESAVDNNHPLKKQVILLPKILKKTLFFFQIFPELIFSCH